MLKNQPHPRPKIVGEALKTYIIVEKDDKLILIDKHAAHERMIFDRLKAQEREIMAQTLLIPRDDPPDGRGLRRDDRKRRAFRRDGLRDRAVRRAGLRQSAPCPTMMDASDVAAALEEICEKLRGGKCPDRAERARRDTAHRRLQGRDKGRLGYTPEELEAVVDAVISGQVQLLPARPPCIRHAHAQGA